MKEESAVIFLYLWLYIYIQAFARVVIADGSDNVISNGAFLDQSVIFHGASHDSCNFMRRLYARVRPQCRFNYPCTNCCNFGKLVITFWTYWCWSFSVSLKQDTVFMMVGGRQIMPSLGLDTSYYTTFIGVYMCGLVLHHSTFSHFLIYFVIYITDSSLLHICFHLTYIWCCPKFSVYNIMLSEWIVWAGIPITVFRVK